MLSYITHKVLLTQHTQGKLREFKRFEKYRENMTFLCLHSKCIALWLDEGCITKKKFIQHRMFAHNTQGNFLTKTGKIQEILFLKSCGYHAWTVYPIFLLKGSLDQHYRLTICTCPLLQPIGLCEAVPPRIINYVLHVWSLFWRLQPFACLLA